MNLNVSLHSTNYGPRLYNSIIKFHPELTTLSDEIFRSRIKKIIWQTSLYIDYVPCIVKQVYFYPKCIFLFYLGYYVNMTCTNYTTNNNLILIHQSQHRLFFTQLLLVLLFTNFIIIFMWAFFLSILSTKYVYLCNGTVPEHELCSFGVFQCNVFMYMLLLNKNLNLNLPT